MFDYDLSDLLTRKLKKLSKKDKVLTIIFRKKLREVISNNKLTIDRYKNLKKPLQDFKRIHLTDNFILLFQVSKKDNHIMFTYIKHWDRAYKNQNP